MQIANEVPQRSEDRVDEDASDLVTCGLSVRTIRASDRTAEFVASTDDIDSYDEIIAQDSWDLTDYLKNPVCLYAHMSRDLPIGKAVDVAVRGGQLECTIEFATAEMNPLAEQVWQMVRGRFLRAVSVGFIPNSFRTELRDGVEVTVLSDCCLKEISVTPVPANPFALAKMKAKAMAAAKPTTPAPSGAATETNMSETNETKALLAARESEIVNLKATIATAETKAKAAEDKAAALESKLSESAQKLATETKAKADIEARAVKAEADRDAASERVKQLETEATEKHVETLVGVKFAPAAKDAMLALAKKDRPSFDAIMASTPDMKILGQVVPTEKGAPAPVAGAGNGTDLAALMDEPAAAE